MKIFGSQLYRADVIANSMKWARDHIKTAPDGALFIANRLEEAQGRQGRSWTQKDGQLCVTAVLKPKSINSILADDIAVRLNQLTIAMTLGILNPLLEYGVGIKWPNDFFYDGKKLGGILMHPIWQGEQLLGIVMGFALNVNTLFTQDDELFDLATSLQMITGKSIQMRELYYSLLTSLDMRYIQWQEEKFQELYRDWRKSLVLIGKTMTIHDAEGNTFSARLQQVMPNGDAIIAREMHPYQILPFHAVESIIFEKEEVEQGVI